MRCLVCNKLCHQGYNGNGYCNTHHPHAEKLEVKQKVKYEKKCGVYNESHVISIGDNLVTNNPGQKRAGNSVGDARFIRDFCSKLYNQYMDGSDQ